MLFYLGVIKKEYSLWGKMQKFLVLNLVVKIHWPAVKIMCQSLYALERALIPTEQEVGWVTGLV